MDLDGEVEAEVRSLIRKEVVEGIELSDEEEPVAKAAAKRHTLMEGCGAVPKKHKIEAQLSPKFHKPASYIMVSH